MERVCTLNGEKKMKYLVIDIGGTFTKFAVMDEDCNFYEKGKIPTVKDSLEQFIDMLEQLYRKYGAEAEGIAISAPGMIDSENGFMYNGGSIFCVSNINIVEILESRCHVPVTVENDAKSAALAEVWRGSLKDCENAVVVICGTAVGGAIINNRKVLRGKNFMAGEFSYILTETADCMNPDKTMAATNGVPGLIALVAKKKNMPEEELDGEKIFSMANCGDEETLLCLREFCNRLAVQITNCQFILDPERFAIGGGISVQPLFLQIIKEELKKINAVYPYDVPIPEVTTCRYFNDSNLIGALYVHLQEKEDRYSLEKLKDFMELLGGRREERYLREMLCR